MKNKLLFFVLCLLLNGPVYAASFSQKNFNFDISEVEILDDCGHFLHLEKADEFNNKLLNFFGDICSNSCVL